MGTTRGTFLKRIPMIEKKTQKTQAAAQTSHSGLTMSAQEARLLGTPGTDARLGDRQRKELAAARRRFLPGWRGWRGRDTGRTMRVEPSVEVRGTSVQACGLWPFVAGAPLPTVGVPLGRHLISNSTVCADPISYFIAGLVTQPSMFVLGRPGLGKSTLVRRILTVLAAWGIMPMVLGDLKPDYVDLIDAMGGSVTRIGRGLDRINPLDWGPLWEDLQRLPQSQRKEAIEEIRGRRQSLLIALCSMDAGRELHSVERNVLTRALRIVDASIEGRAPIISDILEVVEEGPEALQRIAQSRDDRAKYLGRVQELIDSLRSFEAGGTYSDVFDGQTTTPIRLDVPLCFDLSSLDSDEAGGGAGLEAAVQLVCWSAGSSAVAAAKHLALAGLAPQRHYLLVMDELWRILESGPFMVKYINGLTRLNRNRGLGQAMITHTMNDLEMESKSLTKMAWGFVERSALVFMGGLAEGEMGNLETVFAMTSKEKNRVTDWSSEAEVDPISGQTASPPGRGKFLLKIGKRPGTPFEVQLTDVERDVNDTNRAWADLSQRLNEQKDAQRWSRVQEPDIPADNAPQVA